MLLQVVFQEEAVISRQELVGQRFALADILLLSLCDDIITTQVRAQRLLVVCRWRCCCCALCVAVIRWSTSGQSSWCVCCRAGSEGRSVVGGVEGIDGTTRRTHAECAWWRA